MKTDFAKPLAKGFKGAAPYVVPGLLIVVGGVAVYYLVKALSGISSFTSSALDPLKNSKDTVEAGKRQAAAISALPVTTPLSYPVAAYDTKAGELFQAMDGIGTDKNTIVSILFDWVKTQDDMRQLVKSYGVRQLSGGPWNVFGSAPLDLASSLASELDETDRTFVGGQETYSKDTVIKRVNWAFSNDPSWPHYSNSFFNFYQNL